MSSECKRKGSFKNQLYIELGCRYSIVYIRKPGNYNSTIIFEIDVIKRSFQSIQNSHFCHCQNQNGTPVLLKLVLILINRDPSNVKRLSFWWFIIMVSHCAPHAIYVAQRCSEYAYIWPTLYSSPRKSALSEKKMRRSLCIWDREHDANMTSLELSSSVRLCRFWCS